MRRTIAVGAAVVLAVLAPGFASMVAAQPFHTPYQAAYLRLSGGTMTGAVKFNDDVEARFGTGTDVWLVYDNANTQWEINSTDCDGAGADCVVAIINDGTDDMELVAGDLIVDAAGQRVIFAVDNDAVTPSLTLEPGTGWYSSTDGRIHAANNGVATWQIDPSQMTGAVSGAAIIRNTAGTVSAPTIVPSNADAGGDTGVYRPAEDQLGLAAGGQAAVIFVEGANAAGETMQLWDACTFANLGTPANGHFCYCSDCTIANPCAGSGTGALAKRLNGVWVCN